MIVEIYKCRPLMKFPIIAWAIMILQRMNPFNDSSFSHVAIGFSSPTGNVKVLDATYKGVFSMLKCKYLKKYRIIESVSINIESNEFNLYSWIERQEGKDYDKKQLFGMFLNLIGITKENKIGSGKRKLICCELVILLLNRFKGLGSKNTDKHDLIDTWEKVVEYGS